MNLTPRQIKLIRSTFRKLQPIANTFAELFYTRLFALDPSLRSGFDSADDDWHGHGHRLRQLMGTLVANLHKLDTLAPAIAALGRFHFGRVLRPSTYDLAGQ